MNIILRGLICHLYVTQSYFREIKPVNLKRSQPWILIGRTDAEAETPVFWSSDANSWLTGKVPDAGKDWGQEKRVSEYEMAGWHHQCNRHELGQTLGNGEGQGGLACCSPWGCKELDRTWCLNNRELDPTCCTVRQKTKTKPKTNPKPPNAAFHYVKILSANK